jgi:hypothetical protein
MAHLKHKGCEGTTAENRVLKRRKMESCIFYVITVVIIYTYHNQLKLHGPLSATCCRIPTISTVA